MKICRLLSTNREKTNIVSFIFILVFSITLVLGSFSTIAKEKTYVAGIEAAFPPWAYAEKGEYKGITVDAMREIAKIEDFDVKFKDLPWPSIIPALRSGKINIGVTGFSVTCKRDQVLDYTLPFYALKDVVLVPEDSDLNIATALSTGATVGVQGGSTQYGWIQENLVGNVDVKVNTYETFVTALEDMTTGRVDSVVVDQLSGYEYIGKGKAVKIAGTIENSRGVAMTVEDGDPHELLPMINRGLLKLQETGKWQQILNKYLPEKAPVQHIPTIMLDCIETYQSPIPGLED